MSINISTWFNRTRFIFLLAVMILLTGTASGALPQSLNYQGYLSNTDSSPVNNPGQSITFTLYDSSVGGTTLWSETQSVNVVNGVFSVQLGSGLNPLPQSAFENPTWIGIAVGADPEMSPRSALAIAAYAIKAEDANTLTGKTAAELDQSAHVSNTNNPHNVTAAQVGAATASDITSAISSHSSDPSAHHVRYSDAEAVAAIKAADGPGSTLDADTLDGNDSTAFMSASTDNWVNTNGDTMTGALTMSTPLSNPVRINTTSSTNWLSFSTSGGYIGYAGVYNDTAGMDFGTGGSNTTGSVNLVTSATPRLTVTAAGNVGIGTTTPVYALEVHASGTGIYGTSTIAAGVYGYSTSSSGAGVEGGSTTGIGVDGYSSSNDGVYGYSASSIGVHGVGATYDFYAGGLGTNYGPFTGGHDVVLAQDFPKNVQDGMIVSVTGKTLIRKDDKGNVSISSTMPTIALSSKANDKAVFGAFNGETPLPKDHWYKARPGERFGIVNALGEGRVWVSNINGDIKAGDYITTSAIAGYGQLQDDDLLHSYTLGKATDTIDWDTVTDTVEYKGKIYKVYLIAVVYTSG